MFFTNTFYFLSNELNIVPNLNVIPLFMKIFIGSTFMYDSWQNMAHQWEVKANRLWSKLTGSFVQYSFLACSQNHLAGWIHMIVPINTRKLNFQNEDVLYNQRERLYIHLLIDVSYNWISTNFRFRLLFERFWLSANWIYIDNTHSVSWLV